MNMKKFVSAFLVIAVCLSASAKKPDKPVLRFNESREFKVLQFTDTHLIPSNARLLLSGRTSGRLSQAKGRI